MLRIEAGGQPSNNMKGWRAIPKMMSIAALVFGAAAGPEPRVGDPGRIVFVAQDRMADNLFAVNADGSGFVQLTHLPPHTFMAFPPAWSPDGRFIAFDGGNGAYVLPAAKPGTPVLVCPMANSFVWSRDSASVICLAALRGKARLFAVEMNGRGWHELSNNWPAFPDASVSSLTADRAVTKLAFVKTNFRYGKAASREIYTVNPDGSGLVDIAPRPVASYNGIDNLVFSPDGRKLADSDYELMRSIMTRRADGRDRRILSSTPFLQQQVPSWSPDSKTLAWWDESGMWWSESAIVLSDATTAKKFTPAGGRGGRDPAFSPDGRRIAYACDQYNGKMCVMNTDGSGVRALTQMGRVYVGRPVWRP